MRFPAECYLEKLKGQTKMHMLIYEHNYIYAFHIVYGGICLRTCQVHSWRYLWEKVRGMEIDNKEEKN